MQFFSRETGGDHESASREKSNCAPFFFDFRPAAYIGGLDLFHFSGRADRTCSTEHGANSRPAIPSLRTLRSRRSRLNQRRNPRRARLRASFASTGSSRSQARPIAAACTTSAAQLPEPAAPQPPDAAAPQTETAGISCPPEYVPLIQKTTASLMTANFTFYPVKALDPFVPFFVDTSAQLRSSEEDEPQGGVPPYASAKNDPERNRKRTQGDHLG